MVLATENTEVTEYVNIIYDHQCRGLLSVSSVTSVAKRCYKK